MVPVTVLKMNFEIQREEVTGAVKPEQWEGPEWAEEGWGAALRDASLQAEERWARAGR